MSTESCRHVDGEPKISENITQCLNYQPDDRMKDNGSNYDTMFDIPSPTVDQVPLPFIPGLTGTKRTNSSRKCVTLEHFHKKVSLLVSTYFCKYTK